MTSSQDLPGIEPWMAAMFRPGSFADTWLLESSSRDSDVVTRALQNSISSHSDFPILPFDHSVSDTLHSSISPNSDSNAISPFSSSPAVEVAALTPTASGSDAENLKPRGGNASLSGKISKRKPRASKQKSRTTFIMADVANFRSMVQQVTGVKYGAVSVNTNQHVQILKPEPHRLAGGGSIVQGSGYLPTLDTSAFWLDQQGNVGPPPAASNAASDFGSSGHFSFGGQSVGAVDFGTFGSFPTLESWKVM